MKWFTRRFPMVEYRFTFRGAESGRIETITITANFKTMAEEDARRAFRNVYHDDPILITSSPEGS